MMHTILPFQCPSSTDENVHFLYPSLPYSNIISRTIQPTLLAARTRRVLGNNTRTISSIQILAQFFHKQPYFNMFRQMINKAHQLHGRLLKCCIWGVQENFIRFHILPGVVDRCQTSRSVCPKDIWRSGAKCMVEAMISEFASAWKAQTPPFQFEKWGVQVCKTMSEMCSRKIAQVWTLTVTGF